MRKKLASALLIGLLLFAVSYALDLLLHWLGIPGSDTIINDLVVGAIGGAIGAFAAYLWVRFEAEKQARARDKMILIVELNHHIRNAFQAISQAIVIADEQQRLRLIDTALERVDRVLTELVPTVGDVSTPRLFLDEDRNPPGTTARL